MTKGMVCAAQPEAEPTWVARPARAAHHDRDADTAPRGSTRRAERGPKAARPVRFERFEPERAERPEQFERPGRPEGRERPEQPTRSKPLDRPERPGRGASAAPGRTVNLAFNVGRNAGVRPGDLVGAITGEAGITSRELGAIRITPNSSIVEVAEDVASEVVKAMKGATIRGEHVAVRIVKG